MTGKRSVVFDTRGIYIYICIFVRNINKTRKGLLTKYYFRIISTIIYLYTIIYIIYLYNLLDIHMLILKRVVHT